MKIGVLKEIKDQEKRVGLTLKDVELLKNNGHLVYIQSDAGIGCGFKDEDYINSGANIVSGLDAPKNIVDICDIIVKIKEPIEEEYYWLKHMNNKVLYTFLHLAANKKLATELLENKVIGISYDTIEDENGFLPLLKPMSIIAGELAIEIANKYNEQLGKVFIVGCGVAGMSAIKKALELNATNICVYEPNVDRIKQMEEMFYDNSVDFASCLRHVTKELYRSDIIIGSALKKGQKAPQVITEEMVNNMKKGAFVVDISIDQGGCIFGSRPTTHSEPIYNLNGINYCCIPNLPGQRPLEATNAITSLSVPHLLNMANQGIENYLNNSKEFYAGLNTKDGIIVNKTVAKELETLND